MDPLVIALVRASMITTGVWESAVEGLSIVAHVLIAAA